MSDKSEPLMRDVFNRDPEIPFEEKIRSINFGGIKPGSDQGEDSDFKRKLDRDLNEMSRDGQIPPEIADAQAGIAGLCEPQKGELEDKPTRRKI